MRTSTMSMTISKSIDHIRKFEKYCCKTLKKVSLIGMFWFYFTPKHFLIGDAATTKEVVITGFPLWQSQRFHCHDTYARVVLFWRGSVFRFRPICFCTTLFVSAPLRSARGAKNQAEIICIRRYGTAVCWNGTLYRGAISKACWNCLNIYGQGGGREEGRASPPFSAITPSPAEV